MKYSDFLKDNYDMLLDIVNCMRVGVWITDGAGNVVMVNDESIRTGGLSREELIGRNMAELIEIGYILDESSIINVINSGKEESIIQEEGKGCVSLAVSVPVFYKGEIDLIICIERDISDIAVLGNMLDTQRNMTKELRNQLMNIWNNKKSPLEKSSDVMITGSSDMIYLKERIKSIAALDATVMITGESGTGKEVVANMIHSNSQRADMPFVKINCAAIPETLLESEFFGYEKGSFTGADQNGRAGIFEMADGGTLFLDEIGELPLPLQSKLLRVLQEKEVRRLGSSEGAVSVDVRLIAATNKKLKEEMENGNFRSDLYYRLFVVPIEIPPLRSRKEDISQLAHYFLEQFKEQYGIEKEISEEGICLLEQYEWPGNVRELRNIIERLVVSGGGRKISEFQVSVCLNETDDKFVVSMNKDKNTPSLYEIMEEYEKHIIQNALNTCENATEAANMLKIDKSTMSKKRKKYKL